MRRLVAALATAVAVIVTLAGCGPSCDGHGGTKHVSDVGGAVSRQCNDGSWQ